MEALSRYDTVPWIAHADLDKPHRCPACWTGAAVYETDGTMRYWRVYTCPRCGQRYAKRFYLRHYDGGAAGGRRAPFAWLRYIWLRRCRRWLPDLIRDAQYDGLRRELRRRRRTWRVFHCRRWYCPRHSVAGTDYCRWHQGPRSPAEEAQA